MVLRYQNIGAANRLAHFRNRRHIRQFGRVINKHHVAIFQHHFKHHGGRSGDEVEVVFALQTLLDDFHVQHAKETNAETEAQRIGAFRLVLQRRVVQREFFQRFAETLKIIGTHRE